MHHAYYSEGSLSRFALYREKEKPFWAKEYEKFGIDEARELIQACSLKNVGDATFLIAAASMTSEAQQALLKLFEEPQVGTTFILLISHGTLIETLRSRMLAYTDDAEESKDTKKATLFLKEGYKSRSDTVAALLKEEEGVRERVREFLDGLETVLYARLRKGESAPAVREGLEDIAKVRSYTLDRSPSLKMLLEHLAATLPSLK